MGRIVYKRTQAWLPAYLGANALLALGRKEAQEALQLADAHRPQPGTSQCPLRDRNNAKLEPGKGFRLLSLVIANNRCKPQEHEPDIGPKFQNNGLHYLPWPLISCKIRPRFGDEPWSMDSTTCLFLQNQALFR